MNSLLRVLSYLKPNNSTLYEKYMNKDNTHTKIINSINWKIYKFNNWNYFKKKWLNIN